MAYNHHNCHCYACNVQVLKGEGKWLSWPFDHTLCLPCYHAKQEKARKKRAFKKNQPSLFD